MTACAGLAQMQALSRSFLETALPETLGDFVRERARTLGDASLGVWFEDDERLSYRDLDAAADRLASSLVAAGVRKGSHVAVMLRNVPAFPITWVALGRIGAVMIPVNAGYTSEELNFVLADSDAQYFVMEADLLPVFEGMAARPPLLTDTARVILHGGEYVGFAAWDRLVSDGAAEFEAPTPVCASDLLNIQYTSGTTGFPKGCMLTHDYWMLLGHYAAHFRSQGGEIRNTLIWAPFFYMDPLWQFLMTMRLGATAYVARRMSLTRFYTWLRDFRIHYCIFPEPALGVRPAGPADRDLELRYVSIYGWRREARQEVQDRFGVVAREGYGMTEIGGATIVPEAAREMSLVPTCGLAAPHRELKIVDAQGADAAPGQTGELWVAGRSILWGYYKRPDANRDSFRGRWFRTGDLFSRDADGYYYLVGRIKDMIKRGGENVSAHEVEAALRALEGVEEAAAVPVPDALRREEIKVYLLLGPGLSLADVPPERVVAHCRERLAAFKIPRYIAYVDDFPRTPSRKIQKQKLIAASDDLIQGTWDRQTGTWTTAPSGE